METMRVWVVMKRFTNGDNCEWFPFSVHFNERSAIASHKLQLAINTEAYIRLATLTFDAGTEGGKP